MIAGVMGVASAAPAPGTVLTVAEVGWPAATEEATVRSRAKVFDAVNGRRIGTIGRGTRITWTQLVAGRADACRVWVGIEPRGWVCAADLAPGFKQKALPAANAPVASLPARDRWAAIKAGGADAFGTAGEIGTGTAKRVVEKTMVALRPTSQWKKVNGASYVLTDQGWIATKDMWWYRPSPFAGVELTANATLTEYAWSVARKIGGKIAVRGTPDPKGTLVRELSPRDRVTVHEETAGFSRVGVDEWVDTVELRRITKRPRPDGVGPSERWLDVDIDHQTLVAYEGDTPVFTTLVSTGKFKWATPTGLFRIKGKDAKARMRDSSDPDDSWDVADVPWAMSFRKNFALHGTYWHDGFGRKRSHGCVNLSTTDAKRIYDWVTPEAFPGWTDAENVDGTGTPVLIHSTRDPSPIWRDYEGRPLRAIATK
jgi:hypothetical protein